MKILRTITSVNPNQGGPIAGIMQISPILSQWGHSTEILCLDSPKDPWLQKISLPCHALGPKIGNYGYCKRWFPWLKENAKNYDHIVIHGLWQYTGLGTYMALKKMDIPYFIYTHGMLDPWFKKAYPLKHIKKWLYWPWGEYRILRDAKTVFFTSEEERILAKESFWLYKCNEVVVNYGTAGPKGVYSKFFYEQFPKLSHKKFILFLGRIHPKKGVDLLLKAFANLTTQTELFLVIAGPGQDVYINKLKKLAQELKIEKRIFWPGMLIEKYKWGALQSAEVFILPSHQENFGISVAEALSCNKAVLISNKINIWREIMAAEAGLVGEDTLAGTMHLLKEWLSLSKEQKEAMNKNAQMCFQKNFHIEKAASNFLSVLAQKA